MNAEDRKTRSLEFRRRFAATNAKAEDWKGTCKYCKQVISGTIDECRAHKCDEYMEAISGQSG